MSELKFPIPAGSSTRLMTAGKYCDRNITVEAEEGGGADLETVSVSVTFYGSGNMVYMGSDGASRTVENPYGTYEVVKNSPLVVFYDGGTCLVRLDSSNCDVLYDNTGDYVGHSCIVLAFHEDGNVLFEEK